MAAISIIEQDQSSESIVERSTSIVRERQKSLMLRAWIANGLFFMALPGTLLGFSNLMATAPIMAPQPCPPPGWKVTDTPRCLAG